VAAALTVVVFAALFLTTVLMAVPGSLEFIPPGESPGFRFEEGVVYLDTSFTIGNNGYHDITNLSFSVRALVEDQILVTDFRTPPVDIPTGERRVVDISIPIALEPLQNTGFLVLRPGNVTFQMGIGGTTTRNLLTFAVSFSFREYFEALISAFEIDWGNGTMSQLNGEFQWDVPYLVGTAPFLQGQAQAALSLSNETGLITETTEAIQLGGLWQDNLTFILDQTEANDLLTSPQVLTLDVVVVLPGNLSFSFQREVEVDLGG
jgi:hypothetical protein